MYTGHIRSSMNRHADAATADRVPGTKIYVAALRKRDWNASCVGCAPTPLVQISTLPECQGRGRQGLPYSDK